MKYKVCLQAAGVGSRLTAAKDLHKALIPLNQKSTLSRIIELFPKDTAFVVLVGYRSEQIISFINARYPHLDITFVKIKNYNGKGSGPGHSLLKARSHFQEPFIFIACDTIVFKRPPLPSENWIGTSTVKNPESYLIIESMNGLMTSYYDKKNEKYILSKSDKYKKDSENNYKAFIGLAGVFDYKDFWKGLSENKNLVNNETQVTGGFSQLLRNNKHVRTKKFKWIDTGNDKSYFLAKKFFKDNFLLKTDEYFYKEDKQVIKFFIDSSKAKKRFERSKYLKNIVPETYISGNNLIWYNFVEGRLLSDTNEKKVFTNFLDFCEKDIWSKKNTNKSIVHKLTRQCMSFYKDKTYKRVKSYLHKNKDPNKIKYINNEKVDSIFIILKKINWDYLSNGDFAYFHGDPQPENVIVRNKNKFSMIDWREDFGGNTKFGDVYYDFGKIYHSLILTQEKIRQKKYYVNYDNQKANYMFSKRRNLMKYLIYFEEFLLKNNYDLFKVKLISALIYLNIAPLHHHPYSDLLFFNGKLCLHQLLKQKLKT
jgi:choline kinase